ncbi:AbrB/MazE/SpoVT family DNA-binding domain-containing protein [Listeria seeligeri]|uniref:AbrB/MazE/SpoVT family DNA-binding domain-containing protein n=1 Tax=Listeria seeligeri TaxID=1640 RepID=UPI0010E638DE|nr:toxin-antitoxin system, antitoxin component, AbrB family protein [Listeria seeligeri]MBC1917033.1 toxin-antitoxin system, antitoxin component, AbrB family protein [Listeria seeligeri]MBC1990411.1 toxin-antitoxin system, antitoxin component, AbrB family protein [Listeria seeligeri]MBF2356057.1 toxin-antitoxin system, antitoxin component, AbrB family protein [Listeria seeligeri]MBF2375224.1 toxin-antitoxin system, antitoxin component, AbrB family protein [Listeria seeligeri]UCK61895.1 toxin-a
MLPITTSLKKWGNSKGVIIPKKALDSAGIQGDDMLFEIQVEKGAITLQPKKDGAARMAALFEGYQGKALESEEIHWGTVGEEIEL